MLRKEEKQTPKREKGTRRVESEGRYVNKRKETNTKKRDK